MTGDELQIILTLQNEAAAQLNEARAQMASFFQDAKAQSAEANATFQATNSEITAMSENVQTLSGHFNMLKNMVVGVAVSMGVFQGFQAMKSAAEWGIKYDATIETAKLGIASLIDANETLIGQDGRKLEGLEKLHAAQTIAANLMHDLQVDNLQTIATLPQLIEGFQQAVGPGLAAGMNLKQIEKLTVDIAKAAGAMGVDMNRLPEEVRSILQGTITPRMSRVAEALLGGEYSSKEIPGIIRQWKDAGTLFAEMEKRLVAFKEAGPEVQRTWQGVVSNVKDVAGIVLGTGMQGFIDTMKKDLVDMMQYVVSFNKKTGDITINPEVLAKLKEVERDEEAIWNVAKEVAKFFYDHMEAIRNFAIVMASAWAVKKVVTFGEAISLLITKVGSLETLFGEGSCIISSSCGPKLQAMETALPILEGGMEALATAAGLVGAALGGWEIGRFLGQLGDAGHTLDDWVQGVYNHTGRFFTGTDRKGSYVQDGTGQWHWKSVGPIIGGMTAGEDDPSGKGIPYTEIAPNSHMPLGGSSWYEAARSASDSRIKQVNNHKADAAQTAAALTAEISLQQALARLKDQGYQEDMAAYKSFLDLEKGELDRQFKDGTISYKEYYKDIESIELKQVQQEITLADERLAEAQKEHDEKAKLIVAETKDKGKAAAQEKLNDAQLAAAKKKYADEMEVLGDKEIGIYEKTNAAIVEAGKKAAKELEKQQKEAAKNAADAWKEFLGQYLKNTQAEERLAQMELRRARAEGDVKGELDAQIKILQEQEKLDEARYAAIPQMLAMTKEIYAVRIQDLQAQEEGGVKAYVDGWLKGMNDVLMKYQTTYQQMEQLSREFAQQMNGNWSSLFQDLINGKDGMTALRDFWNKILGDLEKDWTDYLGKMVDDWIEKFIKIIAQSLENDNGNGFWSNLISGIGGYFGGGGISGLGIAGEGASSGGVNGPALADGGIVTGPTYALVGEAGPEAIIPLDRLAAPSSGVTIIQNFTMMAMDGPSFKQYLAQEGSQVIKNAVADEVSRNGNYARVIRGR